jgi:hypothetical protein
LRARLVREVLPVQGSGEPVADRVGVATPRGANARLKESVLVAGHSPGMDCIEGADLLRQAPTIQQGPLAPLVASKSLSVSFRAEWVMKLTESRVDRLGERGKHA